MNEFEVIDKVNLKDKIYEVRGKQVMLDKDLAELYHCKNGTKSINLAVKRNINRFPNDFMFQLTMKEYEDLKFQFETSSWNNYGGVRKLPYVFTEEGVAMLATVIHTEVAAKVSIDIMRAFVAMRKYISNRLSNNNIINTKLLEHDNRISLIENTLDSMNKKEKVNTIFFEGQIYDAYSLLIDILSIAKEEIIIIDNYASKELLDIIKDIKVKIKIVSKEADTILKKKYNKQYNNVEFINNNSFHDRFIIIDKKILYHSGSSFKDIGTKCFAINKIEDKNIVNKIIEEVINE